MYVLKKRAKSVLLLGDHDNWDVHHSVDGLALRPHPTRSFTSPLELRELTDAKKKGVGTIGATTECCELTLVDIRVR